MDPGLLESLVLADQNLDDDSSDSYPAYPVEIQNRTVVARVSLMPGGGGGLAVEATFLVEDWNATRGIPFPIYALGVARANRDESDCSSRVIAREYGWTDEQVDAEDWPERLPSNVRLS